MIVEDAWTPIEPVAFFPAVQGGKKENGLWMEGGMWSVVRLTSVPRVLPEVHLLIAVKVPGWAFREEHKLTVALKDPDGNIAQTFHEIEFAAGSDHLDESHVGVVQMGVVCPDVMFTGEGLWQFVLVCDQTLLSSYPVNVLAAVDETVPAGSGN